MSLDTLLILVISIAGLVDLWIDRAREQERRRFSRERGKYGQAL